MRRAALAALLLLVLTGCSAHTPPRSYTEQEVNAFYENRIDAAWANSELEGVVDRPTFPADTRERTDGRNLSRFSTCLGETGENGWSTEERDGGPVFSLASGGVPLPEDRLVFFRCFAQFPAADYFSTLLLRPEQRDYLYDYYQRWVVPCLELNGYHLAYMPTRTEYLKGFHDWVPYYAIDSGDEGISQDDLGTIADLCGDPYADLDVDRPDWL